MADHGGDQEDRPQTAAARAMSVRDRLLNLARGQGVPYNTLLRRFLGERFLWRLAQSPFQDEFILKGAFRLVARSTSWARATRDIDLLGSGASDPERLAAIFREICMVEVDAEDAARFDPETVQAVAIIEGAEYGGIRVTLTAYLGTARERIQVDIGFGDAVTPSPESLQVPSLLPGMPMAQLRAYNDVTTVAEKFQAMVKLGPTNSRMKDFYDLYRFATTTEFDGRLLGEAIRRTFERRATAFHESEATLAPAFRLIPGKQTQWVAFRRSLGVAAMEVPEEFAELVATIQGFLCPVHLACRQQKPLSLGWNPEARLWEVEL